MFICVVCGYMYNYVHMCGMWVFMCACFWYVFMCECVCVCLCVRYVGVRVRLCVHVNGMCVSISVVSVFMCACEWYVGMSGYLCVDMCAHICTLHPILRSTADQQGCSVNKCITQDTSAEKQVQAICHKFPGCFISFSLGLRFLCTFFRKHSQLMGYKARLPSSLPVSTGLRRSWAGVSLDPVAIPDPELLCGQVSFTQMFSHKEILFSFFPFFPLS